MSIKFCCFCVGSFAVCAYVLLIYVLILSLAHCKRHIQLNIPRLIFRLPIFPFWKCTANTHLTLCVWVVVLFKQNWFIWSHRKHELAAQRATRMLIFNFGYWRSVCLSLVMHLLTAHYKNLHCAIRHFYDSKHCNAPTFMCNFFYALIWGWISLLFGRDILHTLKITVKLVEFSMKNAHNLRRRISCWWLMPILLTDFLAK